MTYSVLSCPGNERTTPSQVDAAPWREAIRRALAYGRAARAAPELGKSVARTSSAVGVDVELVGLGGGDEGV